MIAVDKAVIARLKTHGETFEVMVDCDNALIVKQGKNVDMKDVLASEKIFSDVKKGVFASERAMQEVFGTANPIKVAKIIMQKGEVQITAEHRSRVAEEKQKQIMHYIQRNAVDPKTKLPHPMKRIELAFEEAKIRIDDRKDALEQAQEIIKKLQRVLPIRIERRHVSVRIPPQYAGKVHGAVRGFGKILSEEWRNDGSWNATLEMPGGMYVELIDKLNALTHGAVEIETLKTEETQ